LALQQGRELTSAVSTTRTGHAPLPADEDAAKFSSVHDAFYNHFNQDRHLISRDDFKARSTATFAEWNTLAA
jgi:hypothetical protein